MEQRKKVKLRLGLITGITVSYLFISTLLSSTLILTSWKNAQIVAQNKKEELNKQIIAHNMKMSQADDGILPELKIPEDTSTITGGEENTQALEGGVDTSKWDLSRVTKQYDTDGIPVPVPIGFTASGATGEHTVNTGFVIYEGTGAVTTSNAWEQSKVRNQFVWIPVDDITNLYKTDKNNKKKGRDWTMTSDGRKEYGQTTLELPEEPKTCSSIDYDDIGRLNESDLAGYTRDRLYKELDSEFSKTIESIEKYGGFYIGRYETGNIHSQTPVVRRMNTALDEESWYNMYRRARNVSNNENIQTNMIWGFLWYETLQWLVDTGSKEVSEMIYDSSGWGNFENSKFTYLDESGTLQSKTWARAIPTGSTEYAKANNIYDLAGNMLEWTLQSNAASKCKRGGEYSWGDANLGRFAPVTEKFILRPNSVLEGTSTRVYMYIK